MDDPAEGLGKIGELAAKVMDRAEELGGKVGTVAIVVEILLGDDEDPYLVHYSATDPRPWACEGLFLAAARVAGGWSYRAHLDGEDEDEDEDDLDGD